jgi:hypothetical protein
LGTGEAASLIEDLRLLFLVEVLRWLDIEKAGDSDADDDD